MNQCLITFRSITPAQRGERLLQQAGIDCVLRRTPRWMESRGCGYSLRLRCHQASAALELLVSGGIPWAKLYRHLDGGRVEELQL